MQKPLIFILVAAALFAACKKDTIHNRSALQLATYTDSSRFNKALFINDTLGFVVGGQRFSDATILTTRDGGFTWKPEHFPVSGKDIYDIVQNSAGGIYTVGFDGKFLYTNDTGKKWSFTQMDFFPATGIAFTDASHAIVVGGISFNEGKILYIDTMGTVSRRLSYPYQLNAIKMYTSQIGYICGFGAVLKTTDGGNTWNLLDVAGDNFNCMDIHGYEIWMCGASGSILYTANGGTTWTKYRGDNDITKPRYFLNAILFKDSKTGWAVGENGVFLKSDNGGKDWMVCDKFTTQTLRSIAICPNGELLICGDYGTLYRVDQ